eukprot:XP_027323549.1 myoD family inhibitor domain-containing protein 2 isoform X1 [Anas platyrhynchos]
MSEAETEKVKIKPAESFENDKQNISWLKKELDKPILQPLGDSDSCTSSLTLPVLPRVTLSTENCPDNQLINEKHADEKPVRSIVMSTVAEFSIADASSKETKNEKKLSNASRSSIASLEKCREFTYIEDDASVRQRDSDDTTRLPMKTTPTTTATVTVTLIAAFLSPAMRLVNAWNLPWRFLKFAIANRKILDTIPENCLEGKWQSTKEIFLLLLFINNKNNQSFCQPGLCASCCSHPGGLYICTILIVQ